MRGFTLIEMIVAIGIFSMVSTLTVGSLLILTSAERHVSSVQINQDNVRFAIEAMSREVRTGIEYQLCSGDPTCLQFKNALGDIILYCRGVDGGGCTSAGTQLLRKKSSELVGHALTSAPPDITIEDLNFSVFGAGNLDTIQPRITIFMRASALNGSKNETMMDIQTSVSQLQLGL